MGSSQIVKQQRAALSTCLALSAFMASTPVFAQGFNLPLNPNLILQLPNGTGGGTARPVGPVAPRSNMTPVPISIPTQTASPVMTTAPIVSPPSPPPPPGAGGTLNITIPIFQMPPQTLIPINIKIPKRPRKDKPQTQTETPPKSQPRKVPQQQEKLVQQTNTIAPQPVLALPGIFTFAMDCGGGLCNENNEFEMIPGRGALYSLESSNSVSLARGHMLVIADQIAVNLKAGHINLRVTPGSSVAAEVDPDGTTRVYSLAAYEKDHPAAFMLADHDNATGDIPIKEGQELVFAGKALQDEELIAADGIAISPVEGGLTVADRNSGRLHLFNYSVKRMNENEFLIGCRRVSVPPTDRLAKLQAKLSEQASTPSEHQASHNPLSPVSSTEVVQTRSQRTAEANLITDTKSCTVFAEQHALVEQVSDSALSVSKGSVLVRANAQTEIRLPDQTVTVQKGAIAYIRVRDRWSKVVNLSDLASESVVIQHGANTTTLEPTHEAVFSKDAPSLGTVFDVHQIGHKNIVSQNCNQGEWVTTSEVSLLDEMLHQPLLQTIRPTNKQCSAKVVANQVLKTAAIFQMLHGQTVYTRGQIEDETNGYTVVAHGQCTPCAH